MAERTDGRYRGTVALNAVVPDRRRQLVLVALDVWDHATVLRGTATVDRVEPFWLPRAWGMTTEDGTAYVSAGSGATSKGWSVHFEPAIPDAARRLGVYIGPDTKRPIRSYDLPDEPTVVVPLEGWPTTPQHATTRVDPTQLGPPIDPTPSLEGQPVRPLRVLPVSASLDDGAGRDLNVLSIETFPTWFFLHLGGSGSLHVDLPDGDPGDTLRHLRRHWTAEDDQGRLYHGTVGSTHSGFPWTIDAAFTPTLPSNATTLTLTFPNPFTPTTLHTTFTLPQ